MQALPVAGRERIVKLYEQGEGTAEIAASFGYCLAAVRRGRQHFQARSTLVPQTHRCGRKPRLTEPRKARLLRLLARQPAATLAELGAQLARPTSTMDLWLHRLGWSCNKTAARRRAVAALLLTIASLLGPSPRHCAPRRGPCGLHSRDSASHSRISTTTAGVLGP